MFAIIVLAPLGFVSASIGPRTLTFDLQRWYPEDGQDFIVSEFGEILSMAIDPFRDILLGSPPGDTSNITLIYDYDGAGHGVAANYSSACSIDSTMFGSTTTFLNCLTLGITAILLENGLIDLETYSVRDVDDRLQFGNLTNFDGWAVLRDVNSCISSTCQNTSTTVCDWRVHGNLTEAQDPKYNATEKLQRLYMGLNQYCTGGGARPNSDVIGPGVTISYLLQIVVVAVFFLVSKCQHATDYLTRLSRLLGRPKAPTTSEVQTGSRLERGQLRRGFARFLVAFEAVMVDFHEAQTLFVLTIQVATLWFFNVAKVTESSQTYAEAGATMFIAFEFTWYGTIPVVLGQTLLQRAKRHWWYTTTLTNIVVAVGWWCFTRPYFADNAALWVKLKRASPVTQCGGNPSPKSYCGVYNAASIYKNADLLPVTPTSTRYALYYNLLAVTQNYHLYFLVVVVFWQTVAILLVEQIYIGIRASKYWNGVSDFCARLSTRLALRNPSWISISKMCPWIIWIIWFADQSVLLVVLVYVLCGVLMNFESYTQLSGGWSYGQLVAALVWAPIGLKFIYYIFFGVEKGVENRLGDYGVERLPLETGKTQYPSVLDVSDDAQPLQRVTRRRTY
ncbi:hypothetical protein ANO14919_097590 [Xylariales sp. No.14919]|nr:hypothetical protein ANO14919_097590 [Xylariales sp. No.14919]